MWVIVSLIWSLIVAVAVSAAWALGEFMYQPRAGYHINSWSLGVGIVVFIWLLYISYRARHHANLK